MLGLTMYMPGNHVVFQKCLKIIVAKEVKCGKLVFVVVYRHPFQGQMGLSDIKIRLSK